MKRLFAGGGSLAAALALSTVVFAQSGQPAQPQAQAALPGGPQEIKAAAQPVTLVGCVQREADYRRANNLRRGGVVGTGVGDANEFVLINAAATAASSGTTGVPPATPPTTPPTTEVPPTGATGTEPAGTAAYELTGKNESQAAAFVGKRVEIVGTLKAAEVGPAGTTGGTTAGKPPTGVDVAGADLRLREVEVASVRQITGTCPVR